MFRLVVRSTQAARLKIPNAMAAGEQTYWRIVPEYLQISQVPFLFGVHATRLPSSFAFGYARQGRAIVFMFKRPDYQRLIQILPRGIKV